MSATPVINNLLEARKLLEITTGVDFPDLDTQATINNGLAVHRMLMLHGFRYRPRYEIEMRVVEVSVVRNDLLESLRSTKGSVLPVEQILLPAKLAAIDAHLRPGTIVYTHYVDGMLAPARHCLEGAGWSVGLYTGTDKSGLEPFLRGKVDVLLASSPVGTGLDGLQRVCNRLIMLCLPWTSAEYEQIIGRIRRQGSRFGEVEIIIPQVLLDHDGDTWSWDRNRLGVIRYKRTLSDCALDGVIPETVRISPTALLAQSKEALNRWIERVAANGLLMLDRQALRVPLPEDVQVPLQRRLGDFSELNRRWGSATSRTTFERLQLDPAEWYLYHTLYRKAREGWPEIPAEVIADRLRARPDWAVGDFGCGECLLADALPNRVINLDYVPSREGVMACDMTSTPLEDSSLDAAVFSLSLMGRNWADYLKEAHRVVRPFGQLFIAEAAERWTDKTDQLLRAVEDAGFRIAGGIEQRYSFVYLTAVKA